MATLNFTSSFSQAVSTKQARTLHFALGYEPACQKVPGACCAPIAVVSTRQVCDVRRTYKRYVAGCQAQRRLQHEPTAANRRGPVVAAPSAYSVSPDSLGNLAYIRPALPQDVV